MKSVAKKNKNKMNTVLLTSVDGTEVDEYTLPLVIKPKNGNNSKQFLQKFIKDNKDEISKFHLKHGAVLFRGFQIKSGTDLEDIALLLEPHLGQKYLGTSPRNLVTKYVYTASGLPWYYPIPNHIEMSFLKNSTPKTLFFCCLLPTKEGGETPICDWSRVAEQMDVNVKKKFKKLGMTHWRNYQGPTQWKLDPWQMKGWEHVFQTYDKKEVEKQAKWDDLQVEWLSKGGLRLTNKQQPFKKHPITGREYWANHLLVFHCSQGLGEYWHIFKRTWKLFHFFMLLVALVFTIFKYFLVKSKDQSMQTTYGNGEDIPFSVVEHVRKLTWKNMSIYKWKKGDIIMIDNKRISHGRLPYPKGAKRALLVCWA